LRTHVGRPAALLACAVLLAGCGGSQPDKSPTGKTGGAQGDDQVVDERAHAEVPLRLCDRSAVDVVQAAGDEAADTWQGLRRQASTSGVWPVMIGSPEDASSPGSGPSWLDPLA
jgi:hypothetical protein